MYSKIVLVIFCFVLVSAGPRRRGPGRRMSADDNGESTLAMLRKQVFDLRRDMDKLENGDNVHLHFDGPQMRVEQEEYDDGSDDGIVVTDDNDMDDQPRRHLSDRGRHHGSSRGSGGATHIYMHMMGGGMGMNSMPMKKMKMATADGYMYARCDVHGNMAVSEHKRSTVQGTIYMKQKYHPRGPIEVNVDLRGFDTTFGHMHGMHIHKYGDISDSCQSLGDHYNPTNKSHGAPDAAECHVGDLGNIICDDDGAVQKQFTDHKATLTGPLSIFGRSIVIHENSDDLGLGGNEGSRRSGNSGARMLCCIIGHDRTPEADED